MILALVPLDRWSEMEGAIRSKGARATDLTETAPSAADLAKRLSFLTADGQTATRLEQEAVLRSNDLVETSFLERCIVTMGAVGRLKFHTPDGRSYATGFLVAPGLIMTNHHVFPDEARARDASVEFGYGYDIAGQIPPTSEFDLRPEEFFVADEDLDFAVVAVAAKSTTGASIIARGYLRLNPATGKAEEKDFVTIIQHPDGLPMRIALRENEVSRARPDESVIWYQADTAHGSSGAPVLNDSFQIAALHSTGHISRNERGEYELVGGGWAPSLAGLGEGDVVWTANVGVRVSRICVQLLAKAKVRSPTHYDLLQEAMRGGDLLATAVDKIKNRTNPQERTTGRTEMPELSKLNQNGPAIGSSPPPTARGSSVVLPLELHISLQLPTGPAAAITPQQLIQEGNRSTFEQEAFTMQVPVIYDHLETRAGFDRKFLELDNGGDVPMPTLTVSGKTVVAPLLDGSGLELKYHKFSIWMQKDRRIAMFTASNVDWRARKKSIGGKKLNRETLAGFPPNKVILEEWVTDERIDETHQLPDIFYSEDRGAFDKGHLVRRDDVCWGNSFKDIQMANGDTYHVTNCSPQTKPFNQSTAGDENWGDLESHVQAATKKDEERVVIYAGPFLAESDRWFEGKDDSGDVRIQIPKRFWKVVVVKGDVGSEAYGFVLEQDVRAITEKEFYVTAEWIGSMKRISAIEKDLRGWISLESLKPIDQYDAVNS